MLWEHGHDALSATTVPATTVPASQLRVPYSLDRDEGINLRALGDILFEGLRGFRAAVEETAATRGPAPARPHTEGRSA